MNNHERIKAIEKALKQLNPSHIKIIDDSNRHQGHPGAESGKGHFCLEITAPSLKKSNRIDAHRQIYHALGDLIEKEIHALSITIIDATAD